MPRVYDHSEKIILYSLYINFIFVVPSEPSEIGTQSYLHGLEAAQRPYLYQIEYKVSMKLTVFIRIKSQKMVYIWIDPKDGLKRI